MKNVREQGQKKQRSQMAKKKPQTRGKCVFSRLGDSVCHVLDENHFVETQLTASVMKKCLV